MRHVLTILLLTCACLKIQAQVNIITTIAGKDSTGFSGDNGPATDAKLNVPGFLCLDRAGNVLISDVFNQRIRKLTVSTGVITTIAGNGVPGYGGDNISATSAAMFLPEAIRVDTSDNVYIADAGNNRVRKINAATGNITTVVGVGPSGVAMGGFLGDGGMATDAQLNGPCGLAIDKTGNIYIGDYCNNKVRRVDAVSGIITTFAGQQVPSPYTGGFVGYSGDGGPATNAIFSGPIQVFTDSIGNVYICDQWNNAIRKVDISTGIINTTAGTGIAGYSGNGGLAIHAQLNQPVSIYLDKQSNIFIVDGGGALVRKIDGETGIITTVAGTDTIGFSGDNGPATNAKLNAGDVCVDDYGIIYIADIYNNRIRKVYNPKLVVPNETLQSGVVKLFPNPAGNELSIIYDFTNTEDGIFQVIDMAGRLVIASNLSNSKQKEIVDIHNLVKGVYVYKVLQKNSVISTGKIIKE